MNINKQTNFKFAKNWSIFLEWYDGHKFTPLWDMQEKKIVALFESTAPKIVDWKALWKDFRVWYEKVYKKNNTRVLWSEQQRQIETLMLGQLSELNKEQFILVFLHKGKPEIDGQKMTYWEAVRTKQNLAGDENGMGGDEDLDKITIVNLNKLIQ